MALNTNPARPLTSRELAKIFGAICGAASMDTDPAEIMAAFEHFVEFKANYLATWKAMREQNFGAALQAALIKKDEKIG